MSEIIQQQDSRRVFIDTLCDLAETDDKILLIVPDVGFNYIEKFKEKFPDRFKNFGVTEQSTIMIATSLALDGWKPYVYSMRNFVLFRPFEMVRNGIVCHKANVKLLGVKGSTSYKFLGFSHNLLHENEDTDICKTIGLRCLKPESAKEVRDVIEKTYIDNLSAYIAL